MLMVNLMGGARAADVRQWTVVPDAAIYDLDGAPVALSDFNGKVVLINFWGTWCVPCLQEIPELVQLSHQFTAQQMNVVGIAVESGTPQTIRTFIAKQGMNYPIFMSELNVVKAQFQVVGFPTSLLIDRQGGIRKRYFGPQTVEQLTQDIQHLLALPQ